MVQTEEHDEKTMPSIRRPESTEDASITERTIAHLRNIKAKLPGFLARRKARLSSVPPVPIQGAYSNLAR